MVFAIFVVVVLGGLLLGFWLKEKSARAFWFTTLAIAVASFIAFAIFSRHPCSYEEWHWSSKAAHLTLSGVWCGLYFAAGLTGPAFSKTMGRSIAISAASAIATVTVGTYIVLLLSCGLAGACPFSAMQTAACRLGG